MTTANKRHRHSRSAEALEYRGWYALAIWRGKDGLRQQQLARQPLCERCKKAGKITVATVVNHKRPHKGNWQLFADPKNHESACKDHHDGLIQREEARGHEIGADINGRPVDPQHPWNAAPPEPPPPVAYYDGI